MISELIAILMLAAAIAAVAWIWPRLQQPPKRSLRINHPAASTPKPAPGPVVAPASVSGQESARLRHELAERMRALRQARKPSPPVVPQASSNDDDDGPVIGFAETMIQEDTQA